MASDTIPHLQFPSAIGGDGHFLVVDQDSEEDILGCVYMAALTPKGTRLYAPDFGISDYTFVQEPMPLNKLMDELIASEPRAVLDSATTQKLLDNTITVGVGNVG